MLVLSLISKQKCWRLTTIIVASIGAGLIALMMIYGDLSLDFQYPVANDYYQYAVWPALDAFNSWVRVLYWIATMVGLIIVAIRYSSNRLWYINSHCLGTKQFFGIFALKSVCAAIKLRIFNYYLVYILGDILRVLLYLILIRIAATRDLEPDPDAKPPVEPIAMAPQLYQPYQPVQGHQQLVYANQQPAGGQHPYFTQPGGPQVAYYAPTLTEQAVKPVEQPSHEGVKQVADVNPYVPIGASNASESAD